MESRGPRKDAGKRGPDKKGSKESKGPKNTQDPDEQGSVPLEVPAVLIDESPGVAPPAHQVTEAIKPGQQAAVQAVKSVALPLAPVVTDVVTRVNVVLDSVEDDIPALSLSPLLSAKR